MPTYREIANAIADRIAAGEWKPGDRLPSTKAVGDEYDVSEATAYRALSLLVDRGILVGRAGKARYVSGGPNDA